MTKASRVTKPVEVEPYDNNPKLVGSYQELDGVIMDFHRNIDKYDEEFYLEATPEFFEALVKGQKTQYLTYGKPGVKIYIKGTKDAIDKEENLPADEWRTRQILQKSGAV